MKRPAGMNRWFLDPSRPSMMFVPWHERHSFCGGLGGMSLGPPGSAAFAPLGLGYPPALPLESPLRVTRSHGRQDDAQGDLLRHRRHAVLDQLVRDACARSLG